MWSTQQAVRIFTSEFLQLGKVDYNMVSDKAGILSKVEVLCLHFVWNKKLEPTITW